LIDAGPIDVRDGKLWQGDGVAMPDPGQGSTTSVPAGTPDVVLLDAVVASGGDQVAAVEVRVADGAPVRWVEVPTLGGGTDGGQMGLASVVGVGALARVRSFDDEQDEYHAAAQWITACSRFTLAGAGESPAVALAVNLGGDGGWPGAVGYDAQGEPVDVVLSAGAIPWSLLGLPGTPPAEAAADEPSASPSP